MIRTKADYLKYIEADKNASHRQQGGILRKIFFSESYYILEYLKALRKLEYLTNKNKNLIDRVAYVFVFYKYRKLGFKMHLNIPVNVAGPGLNINHFGGIIINTGVRIGANCTLQPGVIIGQKDTIENVATIGDNVILGPGAKVIGKVVIGNNVVVAPNTVVIKDIPDNCVVSGIPARIIKQNGTSVPAS